MHLLATVVMIVVILGLSRSAAPNTENSLNSKKYHHLPGRSEIFLDSSDVPTEVDDENSEISSRGVPPSTSPEEEEENNPRSLCKGQSSFTRVKQLVREQKNTILPSNTLEQGSNTPGCRPDVGKVVHNGKGNSNIKPSFDLNSNFNTPLLNTNIQQPSPNTQPSSWSPQINVNVPTKNVIYDLKQNGKNHVKLHNENIQAQSATSSQNRDKALTEISQMKNYNVVPTLNIDKIIYSQNKVPTETVKIKFPEEEFNKLRNEKYGSKIQCGTVISELSSNNCINDGNKKVINDLYNDMVKPFKSTNTYDVKLDTHLKAQIQNKQNKIPSTFTNFVPQAPVKDPGPSDEGQLSILKKYPGTLLQGNKSLESNEYINNINSGENGRLQPLNDSVIKNIINDFKKQSIENKYTNLMANNTHKINNNAIGEKISTAQRKDFITNFLTNTKNENQQTNTLGIKDNNSNEQQNSPSMIDKQKIKNNNLNSAEKTEPFKDTSEIIKYLLLNEAQNKNNNENNLNIWNSKTNNNDNKITNNYSKEDKCNGVATQTLNEYLGNKNTIYQNEANKQTNIELSKKPVCCSDNINILGSLLTNVINEICSGNSYHVKTANSVDKEKVTLQLTLTVKPCSSDT